MRAYFILFCLMMVSTALMTIKNMAVTLLWLTLGLGFPLLFAPSWLIYMICLLPAVACWRLPRLRLPTVTISLALAAAVAVTPALLSRKEAKQMAAAAEKLDIRPGRLSASRSMEIIRPAGGDYHHKFLNEACPAECRHLLVSGQMDWVRVKMTAEAGNSQSVTQTSTFVVGKGEQCSIGGDDRAEAARCVLAGANNKDKAGLQVEVGYRAMKSDSGSGLSRIESLRLLSISSLSDGAYQTQFRQTESTIYTTFMPLLVGPQVNGTSSSGFQALQTFGHYNAISFQGALESFGYIFTGMEASTEKPRTYKDNTPPSEALTLEVLSILDLPGKEELNQQQMDTINMWVMQARAYGGPKNTYPFTEATTALVRRLLDDRRIENISFIDQLLQRDPEMLAAFVPTILSSLEGADAPRAVSKSAARSLRILDSKVLAPYAARINQIRRRHFQRGHDPLAGAATRLGVNPVPLLPLDADDEDYSNKLGALCRADKTWSPEIRAAVIAYAASLTARTPNLRSKLNSIEYVVTRHGGWDDLIPIYNARVPNKMNMLSASRARLEKYPDRCG